MPSTPGCVPVHGAGSPLLASAGVVRDSHLPVAAGGAPASSCSCRARSFAGPGDRWAGGGAAQAPGRPVHSGGACEPVRRRHDVVPAGDDEARPGRSLGMGGGRGGGRRVCQISTRGDRLRGWQAHAVGGVALVVAGAAGAADNYAVLLDLDLHGPVPGPVLGVDGVLLDGWVQPQAVALLAVVEGTLEWAGVAPGGARAATPAAAGAFAGAGASGLLSILGGLIVGFFGLRPGELSLRLGGLELGGDERVVLSTQVDLLGVVAGCGALGGLLVADQLVLALELLDVADGHLELVSDPSVSSALAHPGADLVEVRAQRFPGHGR